MPLRIKLTHRGPLIGSPELRFNAVFLFAGTIPKLHNDDVAFSFGRVGAAAGDISLAFLKTMAVAKDVNEFMSQWRQTMTAEKGYRVMAANMIMADNPGNIAYQQAANV